MQTEEILHMPNDKLGTGIICFKLRTGILIRANVKHAQRQTNLCGFQRIHCHYNFKDIACMRQYLQDLTHVPPHQIFTLRNLTIEHSFPSLRLE